MAKPGIRIKIPGFGAVEIGGIASDFIGTLAFDGKLLKGVKKRFKDLADKLDIYGSWRTCSSVDGPDFILPVHRSLFVASTSTSFAPACGSVCEGKTQT